MVLLEYADCVMTIWTPRFGEHEETVLFDEIEGRDHDE
jgi:hypothetical protein